MEKQKVILSFNLFIVISMLSIYFFSDSIPNEVSIHYNILGEVDKYGNKQNLLMLIGLCLSLIVLFYYLSKNPHKANYPFTITEDNKEKSYKKMIVFISILSVVITLLFFLMFLNSIGFLGYQGYIKSAIVFLFLLPPFTFYYFLKK